MKQSTSRDLFGIRPSSNLKPDRSIAALSGENIAQFPGTPILRGSLSKDLGTTKIVVVNVYSDVAHLPEDFEFVFTSS
jgi:hypothetical protein